MKRSLLKNGIFLAKLALKIFLIINISDLINYIYKCIIIKYAGINDYMRDAIIIVKLYSNLLAFLNNFMTFSQAKAVWSIIKLFTYFQMLSIYFLINKIPK